MEKNTQLNFSSIFSQSLEVMKWSLKKYRMLFVVLGSLLLLSDIVMYLCTFHFFYYNVFAYFRIAKILQEVVLVSAPIFAIYMTLASKNRENENNGETILELFFKDILPLISTGLVVLFLEIIPFMLILSSAVMKGKNNVFSLMGSPSTISLFFLSVAFTCCMMIYINLRLLFVNQAVIIDKQYNMTGLKKSFETTRGHMLLCICFYLLPLIFLISVRWLELMGNNIYLQIIMNVCGLLVGVFSSIAISVLYLNCSNRDEENNFSQISGEDFIKKRKFDKLVIIMLTFFFTMLLMSFFKFGISYMMRSNMSLIMFYTIMTSMQWLYGLIILKIISKQKNIEVKKSHFFSAACFMVGVSFLVNGMMFNIPMFLNLTEIFPDNYLEAVFFLMLGFFPVCHILGGLSLGESLSENFRLIKKNIDLIIIVALLHSLGGSGYLTNIFQWIGYNDSIILSAISYNLTLMPYLFGSFIFTYGFLRDKEKQTLQVDLEKKPV